MKKIHDMILAFLIAAALLCGGAILYTGAWNAEALPAQWVENSCENDDEDEDEGGGGGEGGGEGDTGAPADEMPAGFTG